MRRLLIVQAMLLTMGLVLAGCGDEQAASYHVVSPGTHTCAEGQDIAVETNKETFRIAGACGRLLVKGEGNRLTVGSARSVAIKGSGNVVEVDAVDAVKVDGFRNTVTYKRGLTGQVSRVETTGDANTVLPSSK